MSSLGGFSPLENTVVLDPDNEFIAVAGDLDLESVLAALGGAVLDCVGASFTDRDLDPVDLLLSQAAFDGSLFYD